MATEGSLTSSAGDSKYSTCPARLGRRSSLKRDSNQISLWELQEAMLNDSTAAAVESSEVAPSRLSGTSAHSAVSDYGSWPRSRKQRTCERASPARASVLSMWTAPDASLAPFAPFGVPPLVPLAPAATSDAATPSGSVAELDAMCLSAAATDEASEGIALATLEAMARELSADAESETESESEGSLLAAGAGEALGACGQAACAAASPEPTGAAAAVGGGVAAAAEELELLLAVGLPPASYSPATYARLRRPPACAVASAASPVGEAEVDETGLDGGDLLAAGDAEVAGDAGDGNQNDLLAGDLFLLLQQPGSWEQSGGGGGGYLHDTMSDRIDVGQHRPSIMSPSPLPQRPPPPSRAPPPPDLSSLLGGLGVGGESSLLGPSVLSMMVDIPMPNMGESSPALGPAPPPASASTASTAHTAAAAAGPSGAGGGGGRAALPLHAVTPRADWVAAEDELIRQGVAMFGCKWRRIATQLPGRSDDAVRNRWHRLQPGGKPSACHPNPRPQPGAAGGAGAAAGPVLAPRPAAPRSATCSGLRASTAAAAANAAAAAAASSSSASSSQGDSPKVERVSWTDREDKVILDGVSELGHKWNRLAQRLHGRTEHAIRNRYHRLQTSAADKHGPPPQGLHTLQALQTSLQPQRAGGAAAREARGGGEAAAGMLGMRKVAAADLAAELDIELAAEIEISLPPLSPTAAFRLHCI